MFSNKIKSLALLLILTLFLILSLSIKKSPDNEIENQSNLTQDAGTGNRPVSTLADSVKNIVVEEFSKAVSPSGDKALVEDSTPTLAPAAPAQQRVDKEAQPERFKEDVLQTLKPTLSPDELPVSLDAKQAKLNGGGPLQVSKEYSQSELLNQAAYWDSRGRSDLAEQIRKKLQAMETSPVSGETSHTEYKAFYRLTLSRHLGEASHTEYKTVSGRNAEK